MELPPGVAYLLQRIPYLISPLLATYALIYIAETTYKIHLSTWIAALAYLTTLPLTLALSSLYHEISVRIQAAANGAVLAPSRPDWSPGGISTLVSMLRNAKQGYLGDGIDTVAEVIGGYTFKSRVLFQDRIFTADPEHIKIILATQFEAFEKGPETRFLFYPLLGTGVFAADGDLWKFHRSMTRPFFSKDRISHFDIFDKHAEDAINQLKTRLEEGFPVDFQDLAARFTLDSATEFLFGSDVRSLSAGLPYPYYSTGHHVAEEHNDASLQFAKAFSEAQSIISNRLRFGVHWPLFEFWNDEIKGPIKIIYGFIDAIVADAIFRRRIDKATGLEKKPDEKDEQTLLENLMDSTEDPIILRDEIMSLLVAGRDTTASTLSFIVYMLAEHPDVLHRLREEIIQRVGPNRRPTSDDFREMKYLRAVINETLRLYPIVPFNIRASTRASVWPSKDPNKKPIYIPANTRTPYSVLVMHRRKDLWGPDALEFDPDRFLDERLHKYLTPNPFIFLPFNAGPRICLGQQFAYNEVSYFLVKLLQSFTSFSLATDAQHVDSRPPESWARDAGRKGKEKIWPGRHLTMYIKGGLWVHMESAK